MPLVTPEQFVAAAGGGNPADPNITRMLEAASEAALAYMDRTIGASVVTEEREFFYDGSGFLDIDDAQSVLDVTFSYANIDTHLSTEEWRAMKLGPVYGYLILPVSYMGASPEMGFERNMDRLYAEGRLMTLPPTVKVMAQWGWPTVPYAVQQAVIWIASGMRPETSGPFISESISGYSRTIGTTQGVIGIPMRAAELLDPFIRIKV